MNLINKQYACYDTSGNYPEPRSWERDTNCNGRGEICHNITICPNEDAYYIWYCRPCMIRHIKDIVSFSS